MPAMTTRIEEAQYREMLIWIAQTCHNAYHPVGNWWDCKKDICDSTLRFLDGEYEVTPRSAAKWQDFTGEILGEIATLFDHPTRGPIKMREKLTGQRPS